MMATLWATPTWTGIRTVSAWAKSAYLTGLGTFDRLSVTAKNLRRGGLDINPCRSLHPHRPDMGRLARQ